MKKSIDTTTAPRIGQPWPEQGGLYAGIMAGHNGHPDYHLIVATPEQGEITDIAWGEYGKKIKGAASYHDGQANTADMAAAGLALGQRIRALQIDGHTDWHLPSQAEIHLMAANLKDRLNQDDWYWTSTQYSANHAWVQDFLNGYQGSVVSKDSKGRARAVRMIQISA